MITDPISITYNAVAKSLNRINQDSYGAVYYLDDTTNLMRFTLTVKHTIPAPGKAPESHLMRLDVDMLNADGSLLRTVTSWGVMKTDTASQDLVSSQRTQAAFLTAWTVTNTNKLLGRES